MWGTELSAKVGGDSIGEEVARGDISMLVEYLKSIQN